MIKRPELKKQAKEALKGNWGIALLSMILYGIIVGVLSSIAIGGLFIGVFTAGYVAVFMALIRAQKADIGTLFSGCTSNFANNFIAGLLQSIFIALWSLLLVIPGLVKAYSYSMTFYILNDNPGMSGKDAITESRKMMAGHKWELFMLHLSFLGWMLLSCLTFGILLLYVAPYMSAAEAAFYEKLKAAAEPAVEAEPVAEAE